MPDFQTTAAETTSKLSILLDETEKTQTSLQDAKAEIARIRQQLEAAGNELNDRAQAVLEQATSSKSELVSEAESVTEAIAQLKQKIDSEQQDLTRELEETKTAIAAVDDKVNELTPEIENSLTEAEEALSSLSAKEIGTELETAATQTQQEFNVVFGELQGFAVNLGQQTEALQGYVSEQCVPAITTGTTALSEHLDGVGEHLTNQMQVVGDEVEKQAQGVMEGVSEAQLNLFEQLEGITQQLKDLMGKLNSAVETANSSVLDAGNTVVDGVDLTSNTCKIAIDLLSKASASLEAV